MRQGLLPSASLCCKISKSQYPFLPLRSTSPSLKPRVKQGSDFKHADPAPTDMTGVLKSGVARLLAPAVIEKAIRLCFFRRRHFAKESAELQRSC